MIQPDSQGPEKHNGGRIPPDDDSPSTSAAHAFADLRRHFAEISEYATYYLSAKADAWKLTGFKAALYGALGLLGGIVGATIAVTAAVLLCLGLAGALGALFGGRLWLGYLIVGFVILALIAGGALFAISYITRKYRQATVQKYEDRKRNQRIRYGYDVHERAAQNAE